MVGGAGRDAVGPKLCCWWDGAIHWFDGVVGTPPPPNPPGWLVNAGRGGRPATLGFGGSPGIWCGNGRDDVWWRGGACGGPGCWY